jgi:hypothetical protein
MPDNLSQLLRDGSERFAEGITPGPARLVRARGDQRRHRTMAASAVLAVAVIAGGVGAGYGFGQPGHSAPPVSPRPTATTTAPVPTPTPTSPASKPSSRPTNTTTVAPGGGPASSSASAPTSTAPASAGSAGYGPLVGVWKPADGTERSLVVDPDGALGIGEAGGDNLPMCSGVVNAPSNGAYPFTAECGVTSGTITVAGSTLTVYIPAMASRPASTVEWVPVATTVLAPSSQTGSAVPAWLVATWGNGNETFDIASTGSVAWSYTGQQGQVVSGTGNVQAASGGILRIVTQFGSPSAPGFWQVAHLTDGQLEVIGAYGPQDFTLTDG